jgi:hypothetical protein
LSLTPASGSSVSATSTGRAAAAGGAGRRSPP